MASIKLTMALKKSAIEKALTAKFRAVVEGELAKFSKQFVEYAKNASANAKVLKEAETLSKELYGLLKQSSTVQLSKIVEGKKTRERVYIHMCPSFKLLSPTGKDAYMPWGASSDVEYYRQYISLDKTLPLVKTEFEFKRGKFPKFIKEYLDYRKNINMQMQVFVKDLYHALYPINSLEKLREHMPAMEQYFDIPEKEFTKMVPTGMYNRLNDLVK